MSKKKIKLKTIVIVCEGQTESNYFNEIRLDIRNNKVKVVPPKNVQGIQSAPEFLNAAWNAYWEEVLTFRSSNVLREKKVYRDDEVWCVFDRDNKTIGEMQEFERLAEAYGFNVISSIPSFELWFYLHFADCPVEKKMLFTKLQKYGEKELTVAIILSMLLEEWPKYHKGSSKKESRYLDILRDNEINAINRSLSMKSKAQELGYNKYTYPVTDVDVLVERLRKL